MCAMFMQGWCWLLRHVWHLQGPIHPTTGEVSTNQTLYWLLFWSYIQVTSGYTESYYCHCVQGSVQCLPRGPAPGAKEVGSAGPARPDGAVLQAQWLQPGADLRPALRHQVHAPGQHRYPTPPHPTPPDSNWARWDCSPTPQTLTGPGEAN